MGKIKRSVRVGRKEKYRRTEERTKERKEGKEECLGSSDVIRELLSRSYFKTKRNSRSKPVYVSKYGNSHRKKNQFSLIVTNWKRKILELTKCGQVAHPSYGICVRINGCSK
jgi:hypothetical protein